MKRKRISLEDIADYKNLQLALHKASKAKHHRSSVKRFFNKCDENIANLSRDILAEKLPYGDFRSFQIYDPKQRLIHAACFEDRIFHHAVMNLAAPRLETAMVFHTYACRPNKGVHRAVQYAQHNLCRYAYFVKIDIASYFSKINHDILLALLMRCFKGEAFLKQLKRITKSCPDMLNDTGLPIGSLTSQFFANYYLDGLDRFLSEHKYVRANMRYMDDVIWWCDNKSQAQGVLAKLTIFLLEERKLSVKNNIQILPSRAGVTYCGFRITQGIIRLSRRRKKVINKRRKFWENECINGSISATQLQMVFAAVHAVSQGTDSLDWRKKQLQRYPAIDV